jgi:hypothetical protein
MRRLSILTLALACQLPAAAVLAQMGAGSTTPLAADLRKIPVGSWSEYTMTSAWGRA